MKTCTCIFSVLVLFIVLTGACNEASVEQNSNLKIRIQNNSPYTMEDVTVVFPADTIRYGDISPEEKSGYRDVIKAYMYAYIETVVDGKELVLQPIDYVGESLLKSGQYTYELSLDEERFNSDNFRYSLSLELTQQ